MPSSSIHRRPAPASHATATSFLIRLQSAHQDFIECLSAIHEIVSAPVLVADTFAAAHRNFSDIKLARTQTVAECLKFLLPRVSEAEREQLAHLGECMRNVSKLSAEHIREWNFQAVRWHWRRHQAAWRAIRSHWLDAIEEEQLVLYPLLEKYS